MRNRLGLLFSLGRPFSPLYSAAMKIREKMYSAHVFKQHKLPVPVISVGNLVLGGTGKTPTVRHIAELLSKNGLQVAIVSRGYGGKAKQKVNIVSDGKQVFLTPDEAGDEPFMLAGLLPGVAVLTGTRRIHPCRYAIETYGVDAIILDDGFQHLSVGRDIDTVLFDATTLAGNSRVFPGGLLREPISALKRCSGFLITSITESNQERAKLFSDLLEQRFPDKPVFSSSIDVEEISDPSNDTSLVRSEDNYFAFCGIANPSRFKESLTSCGITPCGFTTLDDHAVYSQASLDKLSSHAEEAGALQLITTEKDFVKIKHLRSKLPVHVLKIRQGIEYSFDDYILNLLDIPPTL